MSDHEQTLRAYHKAWQAEMDATMGAGSLHGGHDSRLAAACLSGAEALGRAKRIEKLVAKWRGEAAEYPVTTHPCADWAATAVRLCAEELERATRED